MEYAIKLEKPQNLRSIHLRQKLPIGGCEQEVRGHNQRVFQNLHIQELGLPMSKVMENKIFPAMESINQDTILKDHCEEDEIDGNNNEQIKVAESMKTSKASPDNTLSKAELLEENRLLRMKVKAYQNHLSLCEMTKAAMSSKLSEVKNELEKKKSELLELKACQDKLALSDMRLDAVFSKFSKLENKLEEEKCQRRATDGQYKKNLAQQSDLIDFFLEHNKKYTKQKEAQLQNDVKTLSDEVEDLKISCEQLWLTRRVSAPVSPFPHGAPICHRCTPKLAPTQSNQDSGIHTPIDGDPSYGRRYYHKHNELDPICEYDKSYLNRVFEDTFEN